MAHDIFLVLLSVLQLRFHSQSHQAIHYPEATNFVVYSVFMYKYIYIRFGMNFRFETH